MSANAPLATRLLIVDSEPNARELLRRLMHTHPCDCRIASSGEQALEAAAAFAPEMILMSVSIPDQDGWLVCRKLKMQQSPPRIVLTTKNLSESARRFADFINADAILAEPISLDELEHAIAAIEA